MASGSEVEDCEEEQDEEEDCCLEVAVLVERGVRHLQVVGAASLVPPRLLEVLRGA
jgi:hypothetical protein